MPKDIGEFMVEWDKIPQDVAQNLIG